MNKAKQENRSQGLSIAATVLGAIGLLVGIGILIAVFALNMNFGMQNDFNH